MRIAKKIILFSLLVVFLGLPIAALAADPPPALNAMCWKKKECSQIRKTLGADKPDEGWVKNNPPCTGGEGDDAWGMCLPPVKTVTEISFGGTKDFENIGVFILAIYKYVVGIASVLATVMIIVAGTQWVTSGGNTETINNAKKRIAGAVIGLFIAIMSNFILNSINPALVNLRLPQVWMVKKQALVPEYCSENQDKNIGYAQAADSTPAEQAKTTLTPTGKEQYLNNPWNESQKRAFFCGKRFFMKEGGAQTCWGDFCDPGKICVKFDKTYDCLNAIVAGKVAGARGDTPLNKETDVLLIYACKDDSGKVYLAKAESSQTSKTSYIIKGDPATAASDAASKCGGEDKVAGFFIGAFATDCAGVPGIACIGGITKDDWFAIGRQPGSNSCNVNLALQAFRLANVQLPDCGSAPSYLLCSCSYATDSGFVKKVLSKRDDLQTYLISIAEIKKGFRCNIDIDESEFPGLPNMGKEWAPDALAILGGPIFANVQLPGIEKAADFLGRWKRTDCQVK